MFEDALKYLEIRNSNVHPVSEAVRKDLEKIVSILENGQGYLTKTNPVRVIFFKDME